MLANFQGIAISGGIIGAWFFSLNILLTIPAADLTPAVIFLGVLSRAFLHTGLFILAHDAMHGSLVPVNRQINHALGYLCTGLYACLSYQHCRSNHRKHHRMPGQVGDPDFHDGIHRHPILWYFKFLGEYISLPRFGLFTLACLILCLVGYYSTAISLTNIALFWGIPLILSSLQLFFFGTYLPHRHVPQGQSSHHSQFLWSLLSCYHFGVYHQEHHVCPNVPWYQLPFAAKFLA